MAINVTCPTCLTAYKLPDTTAGKRLQCKKCKGAIAVPGKPVSSSAAGQSNRPRVAAVAKNPDDDFLSALSDLGRGTPDAVDSSALICPGCRGILQPGTVFCTNCGFDLVTRKRRSVSVAPAPKKTPLPPE